MDENYYDMFREMVDATVIFFFNEDIYYSKYEDDWPYYDDYPHDDWDDDYPYDDTEGKGPNGDMDDHSDRFVYNDDRWKYDDYFLGARALTSSAEADKNTGDDNAAGVGVYDNLNGDDDSLYAETEKDAEKDEGDGEDDYEVMGDDGVEEGGGDDYDVVGGDDYDVNSVPTSAPTVVPTSAPTVPPSTLPTSIPSSGPYLRSQGSAMMQGDMVWMLAAGVGFVSIVGLLLLYALKKHWKGLSDRLASRPEGARRGATNGLKQKQATGNDYYWNAEIVGEETHNILQADFSTNGPTSSDPGERGHLVEETDLEVELGRYGYNSRYSRSIS
jgi:hypothetical protein